MGHPGIVFGVKRATATAKAKEEGDPLGWAALGFAKKLAKGCNKWCSTTT
jgi:hypothetical protein